MKKILIHLVAVSSITLASAGYAFGGHGKYCDKYERDLDHKQLDMMERRLDLTDAQEDKLHDLFDQHREQRRDQGQKGLKTKLMTLDPSSPDYRQAVEGIAEQKALAVKTRILDRAALQVAIFEVLTPEQQKQYLEMRKKMSKKMQKKREHFSRS